MLSGMDGVLNLELLPDWYHPKVTARLADALKRSMAVRACVAYWTVAPDFVDELLAQRLSGPDGFLCVDYHFPTDIDQLGRLVARGAAVRLHCADLPSVRREPPHLVHAKLLFFWLPDRTAEIWVGSHNWTQRALVGPNVEYSAVIHVSEAAPAFCHALEYLERIKQVCQPFDVSRIDAYKRLQNASPELGKKAIELEADDAKRLLGADITIFGTDRDELGEAAPLRDVRLCAFDASGSGEYVYLAEVTALGAMPVPGLSFSANRFAFRHGRQFPTLLPASALTDAILQRATYFIIVHVHEEQFDLQAFDPPLRTDPWQEMPAASSPLLARMPEDALQTVFGSGPRTVRVPSDAEESIARETFVSDRRALAEHPLIVRKLFRRRT